MHVTIEHEEQMRFSAVNGQHRVTIDLPEAQGGTDRGFAPPQLFMAALGACIGGYVADYCRGVGVPCRGLRVDVRWEQASRPKRIGRIMAEVQLPAAELEPGRLAAIRRAAEQCLLHNTLRQAPHFGIEISAGPRVAESLSAA
jgi:uncharacterized OsmC-like protein